jgi:hypothetical protein
MGIVKVEFKNQTFNSDTRMHEKNVEKLKISKYM